MSELSFRFAVPDDTPLILRFIRLLAEYEKMADLVTATEEELRGQLFEEKKAEVIFAVLDGKEIGFALFFHNFSTFLGRAGLYLEDLYILEEYRGKGYGKALFRELTNGGALRGNARIFTVMRILIRYVAPVGILVLVLSSVL